MGPRHVLALALSLAAVDAGAAVAAVPETARVCLDVADRAADAHGVPRAVMRALTRAETGRARGGALQPWPWTVNMEGAGRWFDTRAEALAYVKREQARGARSFDVGCFQINHRWHGDAFPSVDAMFEPAANADYAARFIAGLYAETRDWARAAGYYHSRTPEFFTRYRARFERIMAAGDPEAPTVAVAAPPAVEETFRPAPGEGPLFGPRLSRPGLWRAAGPAKPGGVALRNVAAARPLIRAAARPLID
ncbi:MAG: lytic transglycosylase domain-containing protein [Rhodobacteraceae bacterium]|nr:MAG: lytic transglycosylase domain-containing protein [Paracoccaceae bacterium]